MSRILHARLVFRASFELWLSKGLASASCPELCQQTGNTMCRELGTKAAALAKAAEEAEAARVAEMAAVAAEVASIEVDAVLKGVTTTVMRAIERAAEA